MWYFHSILQENDKISPTQYKANSLPGKGKKRAETGDAVRQKPRSCCSNLFCLVVILSLSGCICIAVVGLVLKGSLKWTDSTIFFYLSCHCVALVWKHSHAHERSPEDRKPGVVFHKTFKSDLPAQI